ncbi:MAG TPA: alginate lyase family protein [Planctomycetota bacterium]|jgi:hypothetical protein|nr:alginate lyase family protein [Planctomycetota bacterium]
MRNSSGGWRFLVAAVPIAWAPQGGGLEPTRPPVPGVWVSGQELALLPTNGPAWEALEDAANDPMGPPDLSDQNDDADILVLARALVYARIGGDAYRQQVVAACRAAMGTEQGGNCLALGRNLSGYVIAADLVGLPQPLDVEFRHWVRSALGEELAGRTLRSTHEDRPNNWGTHAGGSRAVVARFLGDEDELAQAAQVFKGWLGDRQAYAGFQYGARWWQNDRTAPVGINPRGALREGHSIAGVLPDDQRRGGPFVWPPPHENYVYEALQGALLQAVVLDRAGYDVWGWEDRALLRAFRWLHEEAAFPAVGDDTWQPHVVNRAYGWNFPAPVPSNPGKNVGFTDWTHGLP